MRILLASDGIGHAGRFADPDGFPWAIARDPHLPPLASDG
jgi:hypothetical protein